MPQMFLSLYEMTEAIVKFTVKQMKCEIESIGSDPEITSADITLAEVDTLMVIGENDMVCMQDIVKELNIASSTPTRTVERLVKKGLIERFVSNEDRRKNILVLTPTGLTVFHKLNKWKDTLIEETLQVLSPEEKELLTTILQKILTQIPRND